MINFLTFAGKNCRDFGVIISGAKSFGTAERDVEQISIPGRDGDLFYDNGRFKNVTIAYDAYISRNFIENYNGFNAWLLSHGGYCRLEDSYQPEIFRMARFTAGLQSEPVIRLGVVAFSIVFNCKPQKFLKSGEAPMALTAAGKVYNPTRFPAKPLVRCYGSGGTVTINGTPVTVTGCSAYADIDCELMEVYEGATSRNGTTTLVNGAFPELDPGENAVSFTGWNRVEIIPRWWTI